MDKINSLTGMPDLIGQKSNESNSSNKIFETEIALIKIFESYSLNEIRTPALENESLFGGKIIRWEQVYFFLHSRRAG